MIDQATRIRCIRAILGASTGAFADLIGVYRTTVTSWEMGRTRPQQAQQVKLAELCQRHKIGIKEDGFPVPEAAVIEGKPRLETK